MITLPIGLLLVILTFVGSIQGMEINALVNVHSMIVVFFGTFAIFIFSVPLRNILGLIRAIFDLKKGEPTNDQTRDHILEVARNRGRKENLFIHPLINYAQNLWEQGLDQRLFENLLTQKIEEINFRSEQPVATLRNLAKYPPALGMTGTVIGMIALFNNLSPENRSNIGPNLAIAMTATFYGLGVANFIILPLADRLHVRHLSRIKRNELVYQSLVLINRNEPTSVIENCHKVDTSREVSELRS